MEKVKFFDTTLRDGEQSPGCSMSATEKLTLAKQLERLGVNTIEAGFAASSPGDFESVREIGQQIENSTVVSLCRASKNDIDSAIEAAAEARGGRPDRLRTFAGGWPPSAVTRGSPAEDDGSPLVAWGRGWVAG